jgi:hypothetical protein
MWQLTIVHMQSAQLGTTVKNRENFARVQEMPGIESAFKALLLFEIIFGEHHAHQVTFFDTHTMLAGKNTAKLNTGFKNSGTKLLGTLQIPRPVGIKKDERMKIAVTGMKDIGDTKPEFPAHLRYARQHFRQLAPRDRSVHAEIVR